MASKAFNSYVVLSTPMPCKDVRLPLCQTELFISYKGSAQTSYFIVQVIVVLGLYSLTNLGKPILSIYFFYVPIARLYTL